jgi:hypothetical protein
MITIEITDSPFMDLPCFEADDWMNDNVGKLISDDISNTVGEGWRVYCADNEEHIKTRWFAEFENEQHATWFLVRWGNG